jgi:hypothetical protein
MTWIIFVAVALVAVVAGRAVQQAPRASPRRIRREAIGVSLHHDAPSAVDGVVVETSPDTMVGPGRRMD